MALKDFYLSVDRKRQEGLTDTQILDGLSRNNKSFADKISRVRGGYSGGVKIKNDRDLLNSLSVKFSGRMPTVASIAPKSVSEAVDQNQIREDRVGFFKGVAQEIAEPFVKTAATGYEALRGVGSLLKYGTAKVVGDEEQQREAIKDITTERTYDAFGKEVKPVSGFREAVGTGLELGSYLVGGGGTKVGISSLKRGIIEGAKTGAKVGAVSGGLLGAGEELQEKDTTLGDVAKKSLEISIYGGTGGLAIGGILGGVSRRIASRKESQKLVNEQIRLIKEGVPKAEIATKELATGKKLTSKGLIEIEKLTKDKKAQEVVKQGIEESDVALIKTSSANDKSKMLKMLDIREAQTTNKRLTERATDVVGDTFLDVAKHIETVNKKAGMSLNKIAKELSDETVDTSRALNNFAAKLDDVGVSTTPDGKLNFVDSIFEGLPSVQKTIENILRRANRVNESGNALQAHRMKSFIDETVSYGKKTEGLSGKAEGILKSLRHDIDNALDTKFVNYNEVNNVFRDTIIELNNIGDVLGRKFKIGDTFANVKVGTTMRGILSNNQSRANILRNLDTMQKVAQKYGMKIDDDIISQANFVDVLEKIFGSEAPTSFAGGIERSVGRALDTYGALGADVSRGNLLGAGVKGIQLGIEKTRGINQKNAIKALRSLLGSLKK